MSRWLRRANKINKCKDVLIEVLKFFNNDEIKNKELDNNEYTDLINKIAQDIVYKIYKYDVSEPAYCTDEELYKVIIDTYDAVDDKEIFTDKNNNKHKVYYDILDSMKNYIEVK